MCCRYVHMEWLSWLWTPPPPPPPSAVPYPRVLPRPLVPPGTPGRGWFNPLLLYPSFYPQGSPYPTPPLPWPHIVPQFCTHPLDVPIPVTLINYEVPYPEYLMYPQLRPDSPEYRHLLFLYPRTARHLVTQFLDPPWLHSPLPLPCPPPPYHAPALPCSPPPHDG